MESDKYIPTKENGPMSQSQLTTTQETMLQPKEPNLELIPSYSKKYHHRPKRTKRPAQFASNRLNNASIKVKKTNL